jgi:hypothetical protein
MAAAGGYAKQRWTALLVALLFAFQSGCATRGPVVLDSRQQAALQRVAIVAAAAEPEIRFEGIARGPGEGAGTGAGRTFMQCTSALGHGSCSGSFCGAVIVLWLGVCGIAGLIGGVVGASTAPSAASVGDAEKQVTGMPEFKTVQNSLRDQVAASAFAYGTPLAEIGQEQAQSAARAGDYRAIASVGVDTVLETALTKAGTTGTGINAPILGYMEARVRLIRTQDNSELFNATYLHQGGRMTFAEWSASQGERLLHMLNTGYETLGSHIYESVFLLYPYPDRDPHGAGFLSAAFGLAPEYPATRGQLSGDNLIGNVFEWTAVDSLQPTLRWQSFPRATDSAVAPEDMKRLARVRYDLVIARERNSAPAEIVYRRAGLPEPAHRIETPLAGNARYFWTVRARFELDGRERLTEWSSTHFIAREQFTAPSRFSYRFRTPG